MSRRTDEAVQTGASGRPSREAAPHDGEAVDPVEALVATIRRRDLSEDEQQALGELLEAGQRGPDHPALESLQVDLAAVEDELEAVSRRTVEVETLERRVESLADDFEAVQATLDCEIRWRSQLQDSIQSDPEAE